MPAYTPEWLSEQIVAASPDAVIFADLQGIIQLWNAGAERIFGYHSSEAIGQSLDIIIPERLQVRHWEGYNRVMATGVTRYGSGDLLAVPGVRKDGSRISIEFSVALIQDTAGTLVGISAILRDVTSRWERERELRQRLTELERQVASASSPAGSAESA